MESNIIRDFNWGRGLKQQFAPKKPYISRDHNEVAKCNLLFIDLIK